MTGWQIALAAFGFGGLVACAEAEPPDRDDFSPVYKGIETRLLEGDLVSFLVQMQGARENADVAAYAKALSRHPNPKALAEEPVGLDNLDPTQRAFADLVLSWAKSKKGDLRAILLGTAGTGKTTTLQAVLERLRRLGFAKVQVAAFTGVAASNVGGGARTLHDLFRLSKVNETSGSLKPLQGAEQSSPCGQHPALPWTFERCADGR